jgi:hypothetical protein
LAFLTQLEPPWLVFPYVKAAELTAYLNQGETEAWFDQCWRPFWSALTSAEKNEYFLHWHASVEWQEAIRFTFDVQAHFNADEEALAAKIALEQSRRKKLQHSNRSILQKIWDRFK